MSAQRGVALITALLVMAIATSLAVSMAVRQQDSIARTGALQLGDQGRELAMGGTAFAMTVLDEDDRDVDGPADAWARELPPMPIEGGILRGRVYDMQGRFNLNNLVNADGRVDPVARERFARLIANLNLPAALVDEIIDWIDPDRERSPQGAEDEAYQSRTPPYRTANRPMASVTELRQLRSMDEAAYRQLAPLVAALPRGTALNLNTAEIEVLQSLTDQILFLAADEGEKSEAAPPPDNHDTVDAALRAIGIDPTGIDPQGLSVNSQYFLIETDVMLAGVRTRLFTLVNRPRNGASQIIARTLEPCLNDSSCI